MMQNSAIILRDGTRLLLKLGEDPAKSVSPTLTKTQRRRRARQKASLASANAHLKVSKAPSESTESARPVRQSAKEADEKQKPDEDRSQPVGIQAVANRRSHRRDRKDSMPAERAGKGRKDSMPSTPPADRAIAAQQFAPEVVKPSTPSAMVPQKKTNTKPVSKKEASAGPPTAQVASSMGTRKPAWNTDSISERLAEATKADPRKSEAAAASGPPETRSPQTKSPQTKSPETKRNSKRWADTALDANVVGEFFSPAKQTEDLCSVQCGSEESEKTAPSSGEDSFSKEGRHRTLSTLTHVSDFGASSSAQSETSAHVSDFGVSSREKIADWVDEADEQEDWCEEDGDEEADDEDWQWQCPDGYPLAEYVCAEPTLCGSCGAMQPVGATVLWAEESGWAACEECVRLAYDQPISHQMTEEECDTSTATLDPSSMTTEQIAAWFKEHGAENFLRQCMQQIMASNTQSQRGL